MASEVSSPALISRRAIETASRERGCPRGDRRTGGGPAPSCSVRVDLAARFGRVDHEAVLRVRGPEELVDRRVDDALGRGDGRGHALPSDGWKDSARDDHRVTSGDHTTFVKASSSRATSSTEVLTRVWSNSGSAASSTLAAARRRSITSGGSVPRPVEPAHQLLPGGRGQEHQLGLGHGLADLPRALEVDFQEHRLTGLAAPSTAARGVP